MASKERNNKHTQEKTVLTTQPSNSGNRKRRRLDVEVEEATHDLDTEKLKQEQEKLAEELAKKEALLDKDVLKEYRKYRPRGYKLNMPKDLLQTLRVYCDGIYDLFHLGHMNQLKQCKHIFPNVELIVGVPSDEVTWKYKGLTVLTDKQRCETLTHCRWVDEVIPNAPWAVTPEFLAKHKIDYVAHDDIPYASADSDDVYAPIKKLGKFLVTQRTEGISTSDIITKIIRDYDKYLLRNFARGASRKDLNVSWLKKNELDLKKHIGDFREYWRKANDNMNNASKDLYYEVREYLRARSSALKRINSSPSLDNLALRFSPSPTNSAEPMSPATDFAMKYTGNSNQPIKILNSFKNWMFKNEIDTNSDLLESDSKSTDSDHETVNESFANLRKRQKV